MNLTEITLVNFRSYTGKHRFRFANYDPGLYFITGTNEEDEALGANGVGKSTLFDALVWAFYGRTSRKLRAGNVISWGEKTAEVEIIFKIGEANAVVKRTQNPNSLQLMERYGWSNISEEKLLDIIGISQSEFENTILMGQFSSMFFELSPSEKLNMFSGLLDLDFWVGRSEVAKQDVDALNSDIIDINTEKSGLNGQITELERVIEEKNEQFIRAEDNRLKRQNDIQKELDESLALRVQMTKELKKKELSQSQLGSSMAADDGTLKKMMGVLVEFESKLDVEVTAAAELETQIRIHDKNRKEVAQLTGDCPTCLQEITDEHKENALDSIVVLIEELQEQLTLQNDLIARMDDKYKKEYEKYEKFNSEYGEKEERWRTLQNVTRDLGNQVQNLERNCERLQIQLSEVVKEKTAFNKSIEFSKDRLKELTISRDDLRKDLKHATQLLEAANYWVKGFRDIRFNVMSQALDELNVEVNSNLMSLGMSGYEVRFDVERENKSGGISRGFVADVVGPRGGEGMPFESWSGGEGQRLRLAATLGISNLISSRKGLSSNVEAWDEATAHLSPEGVSDLLTVLKERANEYGRAIFVIDHTALDKGSFDGVIQINKTKNGSEIVGSPEV